MNRLISAVSACLLIASTLAQSAPSTQAQGASTTAAPASTTDHQNPADATPKAEAKYEVGFQSTFIGQTLLPFHSPYTGANSLPSYLGARWTNTYTMFLGVRATKALEFYVDPELAVGDGVGAGTGIAGFPNAEVVRIGVKEVPYWARAFVRWTVSTGHGGATTSLSADENQIAGSRPADALVLTAGKLSAADIFDKNSYANSARTQFMNWALVNAASYDYDADVRGYTIGAALEWDHPNWTLRVGSFEMPERANGPNLSGDLAIARGDQAELEYHPTLIKKKDPAIFRLLGYRNLAHMGNYLDALEIARETGTTPNIIAVEKPGAVKYGFGLNFEQPLADDGDTGVFGRIGWDDGQTESYAYTECDSTVSLGVQLSGRKWHSRKDIWALAIAFDGLSAAHREYLAAGGLGFQIGDGRLNYGQEQILETYYTHKFSDILQGSLDFQLIGNPGYNQDRGPVPLISARVHMEF